MLRRRTIERGQGDKIGLGCLVRTPLEDIPMDKQSTKRLSKRRSYNGPGEAVGVLGDRDGGSRSPMISQSGRANHDKQLFTLASNWRRRGRW